MSSKKIGKQTTFNMDMFRKFERELSELGGLQVNIGIMSSAPGDVLERAAFHEFGTSRIPQRSFIRAPFNESDARSALGEGAEKVVERVLAGAPPRKALEVMGQIGVAIINKWVRVGSNLEKLAPSTIERKGSSRPLIDTGRMLNSVTYEVK